MRRMRRIRKMRRMRRIILVPDVDLPGCLRQRGTGAPPVREGRRGSAGRASFGDRVAVAGKAPWAQ
ncbi:hypothetical protein SSP531S_19130 [Streptomyces spongiicola]|uniref:Uncharacterized protein n=1 Tax=Streptomyces spongiicola TaxID=1690221 RepID=A0A388SV45_9ACTN|nr:hypothetical protein SSP531S_19130 [Streptomyces spongiicola]